MNLQIQRFKLEVKNRDEHPNNEMHVVQFHPYYQLVTFYTNSSLNQNPKCKHLPRNFYVHIPIIILISLTVNHCLSGSRLFQPSPLRTFTLLLSVRSHYFSPYIHITPLLINLTSSDLPNILAYMITRFVVQFLRYQA